MASFEAEADFVGRFFCGAKRGEQDAWLAMEIVQPGMLEQEAIDSWFGRYSGRFAVGEPVDDPDDVYNQDAARESIQDHAFLSADLVHQAHRIRDNFRARRQLALLQLGEKEADKAITSGNGKAKHVAERLSMALLSLFADGGGSGQPRSLHELLDAEKLHMHAEAEVGVTLPYPKLESICGPWIPGDVIALPAYSNAGKSTFAANLTMNWVRRGVPVIVFPTEMRSRWLSRMLAAASNTRQWVAEKRQWKRARKEEFEDYEAARAEMYDRPLEIVNREEITPAEIVTATRVLRKRWSGKTVVVVVDHMHDLVYDDNDANKGVGPATKLLKNMAENDADGGIVCLLLYQPRKPTVDTYRPTAAYEIRGDSKVWNVVDVSLSPYRPWVKTDPMNKTPWGTPRTLYDSRGNPDVTKPNKQGAKLCDEHVFVKIDKQRVGGEGPIVVLDIDKPTGTISERAEQEENDPRRSRGPGHSIHRLASEAQPELGGGL